MSATASFTNDPASASSPPSASSAPSALTAKKVTKESDPCSICADVYTPVLRRKITCKYCSKSTCSKCIEHYLLTRQEDAHCIHCRVNYSDEVLKSICTKTYLLHTYFRHRQEILINRERANLPGLQAAAQREKRHRERQVLIREVTEEIDHLKSQKAAVIAETAKLYAQYNNKEQHGITQHEFEKKLTEILHREKALTREINKKKKEITYLRYQRDDQDVQGDQGNQGDEKEEKEKKKFIRRCMKAGCQGFLSTAWKCGLCDYYSCGKCFTVKGPDHDSPHTCAKEDLETAEMIRKDSKPCPKCGEYINKSSGCFARDTPILLWDGTTKPAQDIRVGDQLVGDDGQPRTVQALLDGVEDLYEVSQTNGMSYTVTGAHTLVLQRRDGIHEITVHDFLALSSPLQMTFQGYKTTGVTSEISVKPVGPGEFYGWKVDGNHRFLLKDATAVHNCSQIWCVTCHTPWDWETGRIVTKGVIHNPHYYEWLRRTGGEMPRNPADVPCGGFPGAWELRRINHKVSPTHAQYFYEFHRVCMEIQERSERQFRSHLDERAMHETHIAFLLNDFEEKEWGRRLAIAEKRRKRDAEIQEVFAAFRMIAVELLNRIQHYRDETVDAFVNLPSVKAEAYLEGWNVEVQALIRMVNEGMKSISLSYSCAAPYIQSNSLGKKVHYSLQTMKWVAPKRASSSSSSSSSPTPVPVPTPVPTPVPASSSSSSSSASAPSNLAFVDEDEDEDEEDTIQLALQRSLLDK